MKELPVAVPITAENKKELPVAVSIAQRRTKISSFFFNSFACTCRKN